MGGATLNAKELPGRVYLLAIGIGKAAYHGPRVCLMGQTRSAKTSVAVAMLRAWVERHERIALFIPAHRLGVASRGSRRPTRPSSG